MKRSLSLFIFLTAFACAAGSLPIEKQLPFFAQPVPAAPPTTPWVLVTNTAAASTDGNSVTSPAVDDSGSTMVVVVEASYSGHPTPTGSDGGTFVLATNLSSGDGGGPSSSRQISIFYCNSLLTTSPGYTVHVGGTSTFPSIAVFCVSGGAGGILDQVNANFNSGSGATGQAGSITPSTANQLVVPGFEFKSGTTATISGGFSTPQKAGSAANAVGGAGAIQIQTTATAVNPTWTMGSADFNSSAIASWK